MCLAIEGKRYIDLNQEEKFSNPSYHRSEKTRHNTPSEFETKKRYAVKIGKERIKNTSIRKLKHSYHQQRQI